jgi:hypothetical protein
MPNRPVRPRAGETQSERLGTFFRGCRAVIVLLEADETEEEAWRRYKKNHPEDIQADARILFAEASLWAKHS